MFLVGESPGPPDITFCDITPFLSLATAELPRNHYNSPSGFDPALRCYTSQGRTTQDGRLRILGYHIILYFSFFFIHHFSFHLFFFQSKRHACQGITLHRTISLFCALALPITSWVARLGAPQTTTSSQQYFFLTMPSSRLPMLQHCRITVGRTRVRCLDHSRPDCPSQASGRLLLTPLWSFRSHFIPPISQEYGTGPLALQFANMPRSRCSNIVGSP